MIPQLLSQRKTKQLFLFVVSVDKIFQKKLGKHIDTNMFDRIIERGSGEGLFKELTFNALPKRASAIALVDYTLIDRDHPYAKNGLEVLTELKDKHPEIEQVLMLNPADKSVKNQAARMGVNNVLIKNDNVFIRFDILIKGIISNLTLRRAQLDMQRLLIAFGIFVLVAGGIIAGATMAGY